MQPQLVDETSNQILIDSICSSHDFYIPVWCCLLRLAKCRFNAVCNKMKYRPALHLYWRTFLMGEHKNRSMIGRVVAPPSFPFRFVSSVFGPKHITAHDKRARIKNGIYFFFMSLPFRLRKHPSIQQVRIEILSKWFFKTLIMPGSKSVKGHC